MSLAFDHVNIVVTDMARSVAFYEELLGLRRGFEIVLEGAWIDRVTGIDKARAHCVFMEADNAAVRLELLQYLSPTGAPLPANSQPYMPGLRHLAFTVNDLDALVTRLREANVALVSDPVEVPFAVSSLGRKRLCYFYDPDGTLLEAAAYDLIEQ